MLGELELVDFLMTRGLVDASTVVDGDLAIFDASRRNRNFRVVSRTGPSYLVKQGFGAEGRATLANEAGVYQALAAGGARVTRYLPGFHAYDQEHGVLVLELVDGARALSEHQSRGRFSVALAKTVGRALGSLHSASGGVPEEARRYAVPPFALSVHRPAVSWLRDISEANLELIKLLQNAPGVTELLDDVRAGWRAECVVHNDYKADNCVVVRGRDGRGTGVRLIDWEGGGWGDPAWDAGSVLGDYLSTWLSSIPITGTDAPERFPELAKFPLERMRPALRAFWDGYVREARLDAAGADRQLVRSARYSAMRLLQTAFEHTQASSRLTGTTMCLCQVAVNVVRRPHEAAVRLLGIPFQGVTNSTAAA
jgi:aminoglycoside phosphotransferase (APT) family kinase protein